MSLLTRRRPVADPPAIGTRTVARALATDAVDHALVGLAGRERFSTAEAARILAEVRVQIDEVVLGPAVTRVLDDATVAIDRDTLVDAVRLADVLLDLRSAVLR